MGHGSYNYYITIQQVRLRITGILPNVFYIDTYDTFNTGSASAFAVLERSNIETSIQRGFSTEFNIRIISVTKMKYVYKVEYEKI
jgi:hypothetical protein